MRTKFKKRTKKTAKFLLIFSWAFSDIGQIKIGGLNFLPRARRAFALTVTASCATATNQDLSSGADWTSGNGLSNACDGLSNDARATVSVVGTGATDYIKATNFNFSAIPNGSTVNGIEVLIERSGVNSGSNTVVDNSIVIIKADGTLGLTNKSAGATWATTDQVDTVPSSGGSTDTWGLSWTVGSGNATTDIKDADFGVAISAKGSSGSGSKTVSARIDRVQITIYYIANDTTAPTPDPMTFVTAPTADSISQISMTGTTATDAVSPPVQYSFGYYACAGGDTGTGGSYGDWQSSASYSDSGLQPNRCYGYKVQARDSQTPPNKTASSSQSEIYTWANTPGAPTLSSPSATTLTLLNAENSNPASSPTTYFAVQMRAAADGRWDGKYVNASGDPSTAAVWLSDSQLDNLVITNLITGITYQAQSKARNGNNIETAFSSAGSGTTGSVSNSARIVRLLNVRLRNARLR